MLPKLFPGLTPTINSAFRFTNGNLYFFKGTLSYEFNNTVIKAAKNSLSLFGIKCSKVPSSYIDLVEQMNVLMSN
jgi:hypothetical protein